VAFRVDISQHAKRDLDAILEWVTEREAGVAGARWIQGLHDAFASLSNLLRRCKLAKENASFPFEVRQLLYGDKTLGFRILFTVKDDIVMVLRVRRGRRTPLTGK
jgi:plasmid stabilization system protein ParE